jgi:hypothetical protein
VRYPLGVLEHGRESAAGSFSRRNAAFLLLFFVLTLITVQSARMGIAGLIVELAQREADRLFTLPKAANMSELDRVAGYFSDSLAYAPNNPWALEGFGTQDLARMRQSRRPREALFLAKDARARFREALVQRPTSPFLWSNLALAKLYLDEIDDEFFQALLNADALGPWEPATQQVVLFAGLGAWQRLDARLREVLAGVVERGGARNGQKMFEIVKSYRRFDLVCHLTSYHAVAGVDCPKEAAAAPSRGPTKKGNR